MKVEYLGSDEQIVRKAATHSEDIWRLEQEATTLKQLSGNRHVPQLKKHQNQFIELEYIEGQSMKDWISLDDTWRSKSVNMSDAIERLSMYVDAEMSLLSSGVMYRDMNLEHVIFTDDRAVLIDLEASSSGVSDGYTWRVESPRGTWETMAPEEFAHNASLTCRTATYRTAVLVHLVLAGRLPFERVPASRSKTHKSRKKRPTLASSELPDATRRVFSVALQVEPSRRPSTPLSLLKKLEAAYES